MWKWIRSWFERHSYATQDTRTWRISVHIGHNHDRYSVWYFDDVTTQWEHMIDTETLAEARRIVERYNMFPEIYEIILNNECTSEGIEQAGTP